ncbi:Uncharacterised protein [Vibrio cholerae]|nr:Uncharacterised protein [Vibrio cholerae]
MRTQLLFHFNQLNESDKLVHHHFVTNQRACRDRLMPWNTNQPSYRSENIPHDQFKA